MLAVTLQNKKGIKMMNVNYKAVGASLLLAFISQGAWAESHAASDNTPDIYRKTCTYCHEPTVNNGRVIARSLGPSLRGRQLPPQYTEYMVRHGRGAMPAFSEAEVPPTELKALGDWIQQSSAPQDTGVAP